MIGRERRIVARTIILLGLVMVWGAGCRRAAQEPVLGPGGPDIGKEEVNVAYGTQERTKVTGAVTSLSTDEARDRQAKSVEELLQGRFAGVQVVRAGGGLSIRIRGEGSLVGGNEPLFIVDGVPVRTGPGGVLFDVEPLDIERIDVLKDLASTAVYGQRGANGVILITTRHTR